LKKTVNRTLSDFIKEKELCLNEDGSVVTDKDGVKYYVQQYSRSFPVPIWSPVRTGILIDRAFIDIDELKRSRAIIHTVIPLGVRSVDGRH